MSCWRVLDTLAALAGSVELDQLEGHFPDRTPNPTLRLLPFPGAEAGQSRLEPTTRIPADAIALVNRDIELVAARIFEQQVFPFDAGGFGPGQSDEPGDALIDVDDVFARRQALGERDILGNGSAATPAGLLAEPEDLEIGQEEQLSVRKRPPDRRIGDANIQRARWERGIAGVRADLAGEDILFLENLAQPARLVGRDLDRPTLVEQRGHVFHQSLRAAGEKGSYPEDPAIPGLILGNIGTEIVTLPAVESGLQMVGLDVRRLQPFWQLTVADRCLMQFFSMSGNFAHHGRYRVPVIKENQRVDWQVGEKRSHPTEIGCDEIHTRRKLSEFDAVDQRVPFRAHFGAERPITERAQFPRGLFRAKCRDIDRRKQVQLSQRRSGSLRLGVEDANRLDFIAEEVQPNGIIDIGREEVDDAAALGDRARFEDERCPLVPHFGCPMDQGVCVIRSPTRSVRRIERRSSGESVRCMRLRAEATMIGVCPSIRPVRTRTRSAAARCSYGSCS